MSRKLFLIVLSLSLLAVAVRLRVAGSGSLVGPQRIIVISNQTGKRVDSAFYGARVDSHYGVFKRFSASRHPACGEPADSSSVWAKLLAFARSRGIWSSSTVYAQSSCPQACGYSLDYLAYCSGDCDGDAYEGDLVPQAGSGIGTGPLVCTAGDCPGEAPTITCSCSDDSDDDSIFDEDDQ